jgi:hypothetical protein
LTALELFAVLVLAGAIIVLLYYYLKQNSPETMGRVQSTVYGAGEKVSGGVKDISGTITGGEKASEVEKTSGVSEKASETEKTSGVSETMSGVGEKMSGVGEKITGAFKGISGGEKASEAEKKSGVSDKITNVGGKITGKVKDVDISTDFLSKKIDKFLDERSDQVIKDWDLATKNDIKQLEKRFEKITRDTGELEHRFNEYRGYTNKKLESIEERLTKLENPE